MKPRCVFEPESRQWLVMDKPEQLATGAVLWRVAGKGKTASDALEDWQAARTKVEQWQWRGAALANRLARTLNIEQAM